MELDFSRRVTIILVMCMSKHVAGGVKNSKTSPGPWDLDLHRYCLWYLSIFVEYVDFCLVFIFIAVNSCLVVLHIISVKSRTLLVQMEVVPKRQAGKVI